MTDDALALHPPRQVRSRQAWRRVLDAGVVILEESGIPGFTIAAVCDRAAVAPRFLYDRAATKDALLLAVQEHGMSRMRPDEEAATDPASVAGLPPDPAIRRLVANLAGVFFTHRRFLTAIVLSSGQHQEVSRRGGERLGILRADFTAAIVTAAGPAISHPDPELAVRSCFGDLASSLILRVAYGPGFAGPELSDADYADHLGELAVRYLLGSAPPG